MKKNVLLSLVFSVLVSCTPKLDVSPAPEPSLRPSPSASPSATSAQEAEPEIEPVPEPESATPSPVYSPTLAPVPPYVNDCTNVGNSLFKSTRLSGQIVEDGGAGVFMGRVRLRSLDPCRPYDAEVLTDRTGYYSFAGAPYDQSLELEVSVSEGASAFYQTRPVANPDKQPEVNYYPFRIEKRRSIECLAISPWRITVSGNIDASALGLPAHAEAVIRLRSLDGCSGFDERLKTQDLAYAFEVLTTGAYGQLNIAYNGRPTIVKQIVVSSNRQNLPDVNVHNIRIEAFPTALKKLDPIWVPGALYPPAFPEE